MLTFDEKRKMIGAWLQESDSAQLWDLLCGLRGPDSPSERPNMSDVERQRAYKGRRARKYATVEVVREKAFFGVTGGCARHHDSDHITLPPTTEWDHFDHHMKRAADTIGLKVVIQEKATRPRVVEVKGG